MAIREEICQYSSWNLTSTDTDREHTNPVSQQSAECSSESGHGEEDGNSEGMLRSLVESRQIVRYSREVSGFKHPKEDSANNEARKISDETHHGHDLGDQK